MNKRKIKLKHRKSNYNVVDGEKRMKSSLVGQTLSPFPFHTILHGGGGGGGGGRVRESGTLP